MFMHFFISEHSVSIGGSGAFEGLASKTCALKSTQKHLENQCDFGMRFASILVAIWSSNANKNVIKICNKIDEVFS